MQGGRAPIDIQYAQYYLTPESVHGSEADEYGDDDGLVMASDDAIWVECGTQYGQLDLEVRLLQEAPFQIDWSWEAIVERSFSTASGPRTITTWENDWLDNVFPTIPGGGTYRLRVHARGRAEAENTDQGEQHLLLIWPAPMAPNQMIKMDAIGVTEEQNVPHVDWETLGLPSMTRPVHPVRPPQRGS